MQLSLRSPSSLNWGSKGFCSFSPCGLMTACALCQHDHRCLLVNSVVLTRAIKLRLCLIQVSAGRGHSCVRADSSFCVLQKTATTFPFSVNTTSVSHGTRDARSEPPVLHLWPFPPESRTERKRSVFTDCLSNNLLQAKTFRCGALWLNRL